MARNTETAVALDSLGNGIDLLERTLRGEIATAKDELRGEMGAMRDELRGEIAATRDELREALDANKRYTQVLFESLQDDVRIVADGVATIAANWIGADACSYTLKRDRQSRNSPHAAPRP